MNPVYQDSSCGIQSIRAVHCGSGRRDRSELPLLQPASESDCELVLAAAKEVTKLLRPVVDMPAGTVQVAFSDALLVELCKCHASTISLAAVTGRSSLASGWGKRNSRQPELPAEERAAVRGRGQHGGSNSVRIIAVISALGVR